MARLARIVIPGVPHHVTQRGNRRMNVFDDDSSRLLYLSFFDRYRKAHGVDVWAYCLMSNHVHWIVVPRHEHSLARCFRDTHTAYAAAVNKRRAESGHLWQGRFFSCPLDEPHVWAAVRYVERNPVRARIVRQAENYAWSSAAAHCGQCEDPMLSAEFPPRGVLKDWSEFLKSEDDAQTDEIRRNTHTGRPCGGTEFAERLEKMLGRVLQPQRAGRKKKTVQQDESEGLFNE
ncbi:MAG TPA: transposase [Planctomycetota bacterium]|nr:transposase [Planctomycetota bacterium]